MSNETVQYRQPIARDFPSSVKIVEVGPRDGLQNEATILPLQQKVWLIDQLRASGFSCIEVGSLVSPRRVRQMADTDELCRRLDADSAVQYRVLLANDQGLRQAIDSEIRDIAVFCSASEPFSLRNNRCGIDKNLQIIASICNIALQHGIAIRGYVSCAFGCPMVGEIDHSMVLKVAVSLYNSGCSEVALADTIGTATPTEVGNLIECVRRELPLNRIAVHFHDTYGQALVNVYSALQNGIRIFDSAVGGLGGCPFADNAGGNLASEDLVYMLDGLGIHTGIHLKHLVNTAWGLAELLGNPPVSRVALAMNHAAKQAHRKVHP